MRGARWTLVAIVGVPNRREDRGIGTFVQDAGSVLREQGGVSMSRTEQESRSVNEVHLIGRLRGRQSRTLPSGDEVMSFRVIVDRPTRDRGPSGSVLVDTLDCSVWQRTLIRRFQAWEDGDVIEVSGLLRRRFWQGGGGVNSRIEVEVRSARRCR